VVVILVRRYARLVVMAILGSLSFICGYVDEWLFLAIIDSNGYTLLPLQMRLYAVPISLKICNPFL
jgi:hypothetical protein